MIESEDEVERRFSFRLLVSLLWLFLLRRMTVAIVASAADAVVASSLPSSCWNGTPGLSLLLLL